LLRRSWLRAVLCVAVWLLALCQHLVAPSSLAAPLRVEPEEESHPAAEVATALAAANAAASFRFRATIALSETLRMEVSGEVVNPDRVRLVAALPGFGAYLPPSTLEAVVVGEVAYMRQRAGPPGAPPGPWQRLDPGLPPSGGAAVPGVVNAAMIQRYLAMMPELQVLIAAGAAVTAVVAGEPSEQEDEWLLPYVIESSDGARAWRLWIGEASWLVRRLEWTEGVTTISLSFYDYGAPLTIEPPV
jgi:hypothetical protein